MTAEATFAGTLPAIQRTQDHRYLYDGHDFRGNRHSYVAKGQRV